MYRVLANDGLEEGAVQTLREAGFEVSTDNIGADKLPAALNDFDALIVRSATKAKGAVLEDQPRLKFIGRAGVGMDNVDRARAKELGIHTCNTPAASSQSVAELVFAHLFTVARFLQRANREMASGNFNDLKKAYAKGFELRGKAIGIWGFGRIGQAVAHMATGIGMQVLAYDPYLAEGAPMPEGATRVNLEELLSQSDILTFHVPAADKPLFSQQEIARCKKGLVLINCARGGVVDEEALLAGLENGTIYGAGLDVFDNEPTPNPALLNHPRISVTPHIGASTQEAQERIGQEMAQQVIDYFAERA